MLNLTQQNQKHPTRNLVVSRLVNSVETAKQTVGYTVLSFNDFSSNFTIENVPLNVVYSRASKNDIENVSVTDNKITLLGVTEKDIPVSILGQAPQSIEDKVMVLDRVVRKEKGKDGQVRERSVGFRVFTYWGITFISAEKLIAAHKSKEIRSINAKVVTRDGKEILSSKRGNFGIIQDYLKTEKQPKKEVAPVSPLAKPTEDKKREFTPEETKTHHMNFRKKSVEFFVKQFMRSGRVRKIKTERESKFAKVALKEFLLKKFPEMKKLKEVKGLDNRDILEVGVVLLLSSPEGSKMYLPKTAKNLGHKLADYKIELKNQKEETSTVTLVPTIGGYMSRLMDKFLLLRGKVIAFNTEGQGTEESVKSIQAFIYEIDDFINDAEVGTSPWLVAKAERFKTDLINQIKRKKYALKQEIVPSKVSDIDFTSPDGFHRMGYSLLGENTNGEAQDTIYGYKKLRSMFDLGIPNLKVDIPTTVQKDIIKNIATFGDAEITRSLLILKSITDLEKPVQDPELVKDLINIRLAILAKFNLKLALILNKFLDEAATFSLRDANDWGTKLNADEKTYYLSGMKFNSGNILLVPNASWSKAVTKKLDNGDYQTTDAPANKMPDVYVTLLNSLGLDVDAEEQHSSYVETLSNLKKTLK